MILFHIKLKQRKQLGLEMDKLKHIATGAGEHV